MWLPRVRGTLEWPPGFKSQLRHSPAAGRGQGPDPGDPHFLTCEVELMIPVLTAEPL